MIYYSNEGFGPFAVSLLGQWRGSVVPRATLTSLPSAVVAFLLSWSMDPEDFDDSLGAGAIGNSIVWGAFASCCWFLLTFRLNKAYSRFWDGTTLLHQMWGEWFDAASCLVAFSCISKRNPDKEDEVQRFRHTLVRLMSLCHASAMEEVSVATEDSEPYPVIDIGSLDHPTLEYLVQCKFDNNLGFNRVEVLIHMIQTLVVDAHDKGVLAIPPPILSRVFQSLSRGQVNLANCKKMINTLYPFPCAQLTAVLLCVYSVMTPLVMTTVCRHPFWACLLTFLPIFGAYTLNYIARELEMPFGDDANDLPLEESQAHMNNSLLMLIYEDSDLVPNTRPECEKSFYVTKSLLSKRRPRDFVGTRKTVRIKQEDEEKADMPGGGKVDEPKATASSTRTAVETDAPRAMPVAVASPQKPAVTELKEALEPIAETLKSELQMVQALLRSALNSQPKQGLVGLSREVTGIDQQSLATAMGGLQALTSFDDSFRESLDNVLSQSAAERSKSLPSGQIHPVPSPASQSGFQ
eukprot:TRINITY_DN77932_c0_g1_i1.p1 TRINITY_DN77932_c0_g1~~TRINITY_DN77932_c0_g1_i1.p1  ORF type:complete len:521 (-),score=58.55 TRINITY_DN77932_c0_g1_i1:33-1595(-)